jgi:hypothetical protein
MGANLKDEFLKQYDPGADSMGMSEYAYEHLIHLRVLIDIPMISHYKDSESGKLKPRFDFDDFHYAHLAEKILKNSNVELLKLFDDRFRERWKEINQSRANELKEKYFTGYLKPGASRWVIMEETDRKRFNGIIERFHIPEFHDLLLDICLQIQHLKAKNRKINLNTKKQQNRTEKSISELTQVLERFLPYRVSGDPEWHKFLEANSEAEIKKNKFFIKGITFKMGDKEFKVTCPYLSDEIATVIQEHFSEYSTHKDLQGKLGSWAQDFYSITDKHVIADPRFFDLEAPFRLYKLFKQGLKYPRTQTKVPVRLLRLIIELIEFILVIPKGRFPYSESDLRANIETRLAQPTEKRRLKY